MIDKTINYVWFGNNQMPDEALKCIDSWRQFCPDYKIVKWNESNFDFSECKYAAQAYQAKMWAFVSDYARIKILHDNGGIYMDVDVELVKNLDPLLVNKAFMGFEDGLFVNTGLIAGSEPRHHSLAELIDRYLGYEFVNVDGTLNLTPCVEYQTQLLVEKGLIRVNKTQVVDDIAIYPVDYFSPFNHRTGILEITKNTYSIHNYAGTWAPKTGRHGVKLLWKYRAKYGVFWGGILRLFPYTLYIIKNDGLKSFLKKVKDTLVN